MPRSLATKRFVPAKSEPAHRHPPRSESRGPRSRQFTASLLFIYAPNAFLRLLARVGKAALRYWKKADNYGINGGKGIRTPGLLIANETLYQLSYTPPTI